MKRPTFSPEIEQAIEAAWQEHRAGKCTDDCGYCSDLVFSGSPTCVAELTRIWAIKEQRRLAKSRPAPKQKPLIPPPKKVGKGEASPLKGRVRR